MCDISGSIVDNQMNQTGSATYRLGLLTSDLGVDLCQGQRSKVTVNKKPCMQFYQTIFLKSLKILQFEPLYVSTKIPKYWSGPCIIIKVTAPK